MKRRRSKSAAASADSSFPQQLPTPRPSSLGPPAPPPTKKRRLQDFSDKELLDELARRLGTQRQATSGRHISAGEGAGPVEVVRRPSKNTGPDLPALPLPPGCRIHNTKARPGDPRVQVRLPQKPGRDDDWWLNSAGEHCPPNKSYRYNANATDHRLPLGQKPFGKKRRAVCTKWTAYVAGVSYCWDWWTQVGSKDPAFADIHCPAEPTRAELEEPPCDLREASIAKARSSSTPPKDRAAGSMRPSAKPARAKWKADVLAPPRRDLKASVPRESVPPAPAWVQSSSDAVPSVGQHLPPTIAPNSTAPASKAGPLQEPRQRRRLRRILCDDEDGEPK
eukprot:TRINITY_DN44338_c0_g1_i2.p1 TRINITY_DN44338_c0_g1~~TRINITY_DN44338_c0_g1_i2.p1  ORF type:complete len:336 (-),score=37.86 TRINITY_DN44338_c0_g1_i2:131-1138(-)